MSTCRRHCGSDNVLSSPQARTGSVSIDINSDAKVKKRRSGDLALLGLTAHQERFAHVTLIGDGAGCYLKGPLARVEPQVVWRLCHDKAVAAANERWREFKEWQESSLNICTKSGAILSISWNREDEDGSSSSSLEPGMSKARKFAIQFFLIEVFGAPEEEDWAPPNFHPTLSLPAVLLSLLDISSGSRASVLTAMRAIIAAHAAGETYDPSAAIKDGRGAKAKIEDLTPQADVVYKAMESGFSLGNTVVLINQWRRVRHQEPLSYGALQRFVSTSAVMALAKRETIKSGSSDQDTAWASARLAFAQQLKRQFRKGQRIRDGGAHYVAEEDGDEVQAVLERPIFRGGVVFGDDV